MPSATNGGALGILWEIGGDVLRFPQWWYGKGLIDAARTAIETINGYARRLGLRVWIKNIFTPMFGQYDWQSRIISVFMRCVNIIGRGFAVIIVAIVTFAIFLLYAVLPLVALIFGLFHATSFLAL